MLSAFRTVLRPVRATCSVPAFSYPVQGKRFATQDYGSKQGGMSEALDQKNPKADMEHPGPESPAASKGGSRSSGQESSESASAGKEKSASTSKEETTSHGGSPAIYRPAPASEKDDPEVRKHNEELENRHERTENQLDENGNKVDKKF